MSAEVAPQSWAWWCAECGEGSEEIDAEQDAETDAARHNEEYHS